MGRDYHERRNRIILWLRKRLLAKWRKAGIKNSSSNISSSSQQQPLLGESSQSTGHGISQTLQSSPSVIARQSSSSLTVSTPVRNHSSSPQYEPTYGAIRLNYVTTYEPTHQLGNITTPLLQVSAETEHIIEEDESNSNLITGNVAPEVEPSEILATGPQAIPDELLAEQEEIIRAISETLTTPVEIELSEILATGPQAISSSDELLIDFETEQEEIIRAISETLTTPVEIEPSEILATGPQAVSSSDELLIDFWTEQEETLPCAISGTAVEVEPHETQAIPQDSPFMELFFNVETKSEQKVARSKATIHINPFLSEEQLLALENEQDTISQGTSETSEVMFVNPFSSEEQLADLGNPFFFEVEEEQEEVASDGNVLTEVELSVMQATSQINPFRSEEQILAAETKQEEGVALDTFETFTDVEVELCATQATSPANSLLSEEEAPAAEIETKQEEQIPHATSEATISVAVEMELSETQATTPLLSEEQTLAVESEEQESYLMPCAVSFGNVAFEVKLDVAQLTPLGSFSPVPLRCERAMTRWAETLRQMLRVEGNRQTFLEARCEAMREESQRVLQAQARKSIMGVRPVLHGESLLSELPTASVTAMPASRGGVAFFIDHHPDASKPDWFFRKHSTKDKEYLSNQIANKMATVCRNKHASLNERQQRVRERLRRLLQARTQIIATDIKNRQHLAQRIASKQARASENFQAHLQKRQHCLREKLAKISQVKSRRLAIDPTESHLDSESSDFILTAQEEPQAAVSTININHVPGQVDDVALEIELSEEEKQQLPAFMLNRFSTSTMSYKEAVAEWDQTVERMEKVEVIKIESQPTREGNMLIGVKMTKSTVCVNTLEAYLFAEVMQFTVFIPATLSGSINFSMDNFHLPTRMPNCLVHAPTSLDAKILSIKRARKVVIVQGPHKNKAVQTYHKYHTETDGTVETVEEFKGLEKESTTRLMQPVVSWVPSSVRNFVHSHIPRYQVPHYFLSRYLKLQSLHLPQKVKVVNNISAKRNEVVSLNSKFEQQPDTKLAWDIFCRQKRAKKFAHALKQARCAPNEIMCLTKFKGTESFEKFVFLLKRKKYGLKDEFAKYYGSRKKKKAKRSASFVERMKPEELEPKGQVCIQETHNPQNQTQNPIQHAAHQVFIGLRNGALQLTRSVLLQWLPGQLNLLNTAHDMWTSIRTEA